MLVTNDRDEMMPLWYLQYVEGRRPDLLGLFPLITTEPAYANVMRLLDTVAPPAGRSTSSRTCPGWTLRYDYQRGGPLFRVTGAACLGDPQRKVEGRLRGTGAAAGR